MSYNGLTFPCNQTTKFDCQSEYDPAGKTDWMLTTYSISALCLINVNHIAVIVANMSAGAEKTFLLSCTSAPAILRAMKNIFMQPRKQLNFIVNGVDQIPARLQGNSGTVDARNGPIPKSFNYTFVTADTILLNISIEANYWENQAFVGSNVVNIPSSPVLYNRWEEVIRIDDLDLSTRTRAGSYAIRSDNSDGKIADQFRNDFAILAIPPGFLRTKREYKVSPDGLTLNYIIEDTEQQKMPPILLEPPTLGFFGGIIPSYKTGAAFRANVTYRETAGKGTPVRFGQCSVSLSGGKTTSPTSLAYTAVGIAVNRVILATNFKPGGPNVYIVLGTDFSHDLYNNTIRFSISVQYRQGRERTGGIAGFNSKLVIDPIPTTDTGTPPYADRGSAGLILQAAAYFDPDILGNTVSKPVANTTPILISNINPGTQMSRGKVPGQAGKDGE